MHLRSGTIIEFFDATNIPSEAAIGEMCTLIQECGYEISEIADTWKDTCFCFQSKNPSVNGSLKIDRVNSQFDLILIDSMGALRHMKTTDDAKVFSFLIEQVYRPAVFEEVDIRKKYQNLEAPAKEMLAWMLQQYSTAGIYVFSHGDVGEDIDLSSKDQAIDQLIQQGFLRLSGLDALVLDRTLADDIRNKADLGDRKSNGESGEHLDII